MYVIKEFVEGISIEELLERTKQICEALIYIHNLKTNAIIYRDMKTSNIMIMKGNKVKIIDFGIAREYKSHVGSDTTYIVKRGDAAPVQYGTSQSDARTDIYSFGVTL